MVRNINEFLTNLYVDLTGCEFIQPGVRDILGKLVYTNSDGCIDSLIGKIVIEDEGSLRRCPTAMFITGYDYVSKKYIVAFSSDLDKGIRKAADISKVYTEAQFRQYIDDYCKGVFSDADNIKKCKEIYSNTVSIGNNKSTEISRLLSRYRETQRQLRSLECNSEYMKSIDPIKHEIIKTKKGINRLLGRINRYYGEYLPKYMLEDLMNTNIEDDQFFKFETGYLRNKLLRACQVRDTVCREYQMINR